MAFAYKSLATGQLPNAKGTLFTAAKETCVKVISLVCVDPAAHTVNLYLKTVAGTSKHLIPVDFPMDPTSATVAAKLEEYNVEMSAGDLIEGDCDSATAVDYILTGADR